MCKETVTEYFPEGTVPTEECDMHHEFLICSYSGKLPTPYCPEDHLVTSPIVVLPEDSIYQKLSDEQLQQYIPGAFRTPVDQSSFDYNDPEQREAFCPLHGEQWKQSEDLRAELTYEANQLINQINDNISRYYDKLTPQDLDILGAAIDKLKEALNSGLTEPPLEGEPYYTEIPYFDSEKVIEEMSNLRTTYDEIFDRINSFDFWDFLNGGNRDDDNDDNGDDDNDDNGDDDNSRGNNDGSRRRRNNN
jgi:penicillin-binding protein 1A